ncbi:MAG TPA: shikimate dehydrogenase [Lachnospiraceae bacterium]|nr:shikimate dehydrogenase [Lachnospiraceae bacterium]
MNTSITGHTELFGLLGSPVRHSLSPLMHNESFRYHGLDYVYLCFEIQERQLEQAVRGLVTAGIRGFNLTMPNKNRMVEFCDVLSPEANIMQAVNTVVNREGRLTGYNTDGTGFMQAALDAGYPLSGETITVIGTGGAGTAICAQAALDGVKKVNVFARPSSRFYERTRELIDRINRDTDCEAGLYDTADMTAMKTCAAESKMIINATSVGMAPHTDQCVVTDPKVFHENLVACDIIYNPKETRFLQIAGNRGCRTFNGMYMLLYQGAAAFRHFTNMDMPVNLIKEKYF